MLAERSLRVLLVEDYRLLAMAEARILKRNGFEVLVALSGEEAVELAAEEDLDLVLMDVDLGSGMDGIQAAKIILERKDLPLVFLSSHAEPEIVARAEGIPFSSYILKESGEAALIASIRSALGPGEAHGKAV